MLNRWLASIRDSPRKRFSAIAGPPPRCGPMTARQYHHGEKPICSGTAESTRSKSIFKPTRSTKNACPSRFRSLTIRDRLSVPNAWNRRLCAYFAIGKIACERMSPQVVANLPQPSSPDITRHNLSFTIRLHTQFFRHQYSDISRGVAKI